MVYKKNHQGFSRSKVWGYINKAWKIMARGIYQLPIFYLWNCFTRDQHVLNSLIVVLRTLYSIAKGSNVFGIFGTERSTPSFCGNKAQTKFNLTSCLTLADSDDWILLTSRIMHLWRHDLEDEPSVSYLDKWVGLYFEGAEDLELVFQCLESTPSCAI